MKIVYDSGATTRRARLGGEPGEVHPRRCGVCDGKLVSGDAVFVTSGGGIVHAISHAPDCVKALEREIRETDSRTLVAEQAGDEGRRRELVVETKEILGKLDGERLKGSRGA